MSITVLPVRDPRSRPGRAFIQFPFELYQQTPQWVPPVRASVAAVVGQRHPFFRHSAGQAFLMLRGGVVVGRFMMLDPQRYNEHTGNRHVRLFLPEAIRDDQVWDTMFQHACTWGRERNAAVLVGPQGLSPLDGGGILVEGFEHRASMTMMPWHPPWYSEQLTRLHMEKRKDFISYRAHTGSFALPEKVQRVVDIARRRSGLVVERPGGRRGLQALAMEIGELYNRSWGDHEEFRPFTPEEIRQLGRNVVHIADPRMIVVLRSPRGELAGFVLPFPDLSAALQRSAGYIGVRSILDLHRERRRTDHVIVNGIGVLPAWRRQGATALLYDQVAKDLRRRGDRTIEMTQIAETTDLMVSEVKALTGEVYKRHRVYQYALD